MPRLKGETNQQWMQRIRDFRADRESMMHNTRAALCYVNAKNNDDGLKLAAFMHLFHPEVDDDRVRTMVIEQRAKR